MEPEPILPNPNTASAGDPVSNREVSPVPPEVAPATPEQSMGTTAPVPVAQPLPRVKQQPITNPSNGAISDDSQSSAGPAIADDVDVIEKEWVDKAKKIVSVTKDDPYEQEKEVSKLQADYLMKRYGKQIKIVE